MTLKIPYGLHDITEEDIQAVVDVLRRGPITQGDTVEKFGAAIAAYTGAAYGLAVSNGTSALHLAMAAIGIGPGDEVITTPITFCATANSVLYQGGTVRFVDIDDKTLNLDPELVEAAITPKTKAIAPVDFRGHPAALGEFRKIADRHGLRIIEDGAHSIGSGYSFEGKKHKCGDGIHADICTFSFHPVKHITTGEGGAILTNAPELQKSVFLLRKHGIDRRKDMFDESKRVGEWYYEMEELGFNYRLTDFQAALGLNQLKRIETVKARRREIVSYYNDRLCGIDELILPYESKEVESNFHLYVLQIKENKRFDRYDFFYALRGMNYLPMVHYIPVHLLSYYREHFGYKRGDFPKAERYYDRALSIPLYPTLTDVQVERVVEDVKKIVQGGA